MKESSKNLLKTKKLIIIFLFLLSFKLSFANNDNQYMRDLIIQIKGGKCKYRSDCSQRNFGEGWLRRHDKEQCIIDAAGCLGTMGPEAKEAVPELIKSLKDYANVETGDGIIPVRSSIAKALGQIGDLRAIKPLIEILASTDPVTISESASLGPSYQPVERTSHEAVAEALGMFGPQAKEAVPYIIPLLKYPVDSRSRLKFAPIYAAKALGQIKDPAAISALIEAIENGPCNTDLCAEEAAEALGNFGPLAKDGIYTLEELLRKYPDYLRITIAIKTALKKIKGEN